ncbi:MAG TPA: YncE family protein [Thermoplasmata archaeon]|nr:YncE family protein [Thermoplasmata archaeon]
MGSHAPTRGARGSLRAGRRPSLWVLGAPAAALVLLIVLPGSSLLGRAGSGVARAPRPVSETSPTATRAGAAVPSARIGPSTALPFQAATLSLCNGSLVAGRVAAICNPVEAFAVAYDAADHLVFVANSYGIGFDDYVTAYHDRTHRVAYTYDVGFGLDAFDVSCLAFDPDHHNLWIAEVWGGANNSGQVVVLNGSTGVTVASFYVASPVAAAYDPDRQTVYVGGSKGLSVFNATALTLSATVSAYGPAGLAYDHANKDLYVSEPGNDTVMVYSTTRRAAVTWLAVGSGFTVPKALTFDPATNDVYVADWGASEVTVIDAASNTVRGNVTGQTITTPTDVAYDSGSGALYVSNWGSTVTVIAGANRTAVGNFSVGFSALPEGILYDPGVQRLFIALYGYGAQVDVVNPARGYTFENITGNGASAGAYDPRTHTLYVTQTSSCTVVPVNTTTGRAGTPFYAGCRESGAVFDPANGRLYVSTDAGPYSWGGVAVINTSTDRILTNITVGYDSAGLVYDATDRSVFVASYYNTTEINATSDQWVRAWNSAPGGYQGALAWDPRTDVVFEAAGGVYAINASNHTMFHTTTLRGAGVSSAAYDPVRNELWVGGGTAANLTVLNASSLAPVGNLSTCYGQSSVLFDRASGTVFLTCAGDDKIEQVDPTTRTVVWSHALGPSYSTTGLYPVGVLSVDPRGLLATVNGAGSVSFVSTVGAVHADAFMEAGLPLGTRWGVTLNGSTVRSTSPLISFLVGPGSVNYTVRAPPGVVAAVGGGHPMPALRNSETPVAFASAALRTYPVTFYEHGLPAGTSWAVRLGGATLPTTGLSIRWLAANGTFATAYQTPDYRPPSGGSVHVAGSAVSVTVNFTAVVFLLTFAETGLPAGHSWHVTLDSARLTSGAATISVNVTNGSYSYRIAAAGYTARPPLGTVSVAGAATRVSVTFT